MIQLVVAEVVLGIFALYVAYRLPKLAAAVALVLAAGAGKAQSLFSHDVGKAVGRSTMNAAVYAPESPEGFRFETVPVPSHTDFTLVIKVEAAALNPSNFKMLPAQVPFVRHLRSAWVVGYDVAGTVVSVGSHPGCDVKVGDRVWGMSFGSTAEYALLSCLEAAGMGPIPAGLSFAEAAGLPVAGLTGVAAYDRNGLKKGDDVLVIGASGGCGIFGVEIAGKAIGANVTGLCGTKNVDFVKGIGAHQVVDYRDPASMDLLKSGGQQFDLIYDTVSSNAPEDPNYEPEMRPLLKSGGRYVAIGPSPNPLDLARAAMDVFTQFLLGVSVQREGYDMFLLLPSRTRVRRLSSFFEDGHLSSVNIDSTFVIDSDASMRKAMDRMKSRRTTGKIILTVAPGS